MKRLLLLVVMALAGCTSPVEMRHPETGAIIRCGPYAIGEIGEARREAQCINDFKEQGYVRMTP